MFFIIFFLLLFPSFFILVFYRVVKHVIIKLKISSCHTKSRGQKLMPFLNSECWIGLFCYSFLLAVTTLVVFLIAHYLSYHVHNFVNAVGLIHGFNLSCMNLFLHYSCSITIISSFYCMKYSFGRSFCLVLLAV